MKTPIEVLKHLCPRAWAAKKFSKADAEMISECLVANPPYTEKFVIVDTQLGICSFYTGKKGFWDISYTGAKIYTSLGYTKKQLTTAQRARPNAAIVPVTWLERREVKP